MTSVEHPIAEAEPPAEAGGLRDRVASVPVWAWLAAIVAVSIVVRYVLARRDPSPWIFVDEVIYSELGRSFASDFEFSIRGFASNAYGFVYPALIAPSYALFDSLAEAYGAVKITNVVVMSLTAVPVYYIARRLMRTPYALGAAVLSIAIPAMTYTGVVMTENAFYPAFAFSVLFMIRALERPTPLNQVFALVALGATFLVRSQGLALLAAYALAIVGFAALDARATREGGAGIVRRLRAFWPTWAIGVGALVLFFAVQLARGQPLNEPLGAYSAVADGERYTLTAVMRWFLYHIAELDLWTGIIPFAALIVLVGFALRRDSSRQERAFVAAAVPTLLLLTLIVAAFASQSHENRIEERNLFYAGLLLLVALMWWVDRGLPRPPRLAAFALIVAAALPGVIPYGEFINQSAVSDTFGLLPVWGLQDRLVAPTHIPAVVVLVAVVVATVVLLLPRRLALVAPALVLVYFAIAHSPIENRTNSTSAAVLSVGVQPDVDWIDQAVGSDAHVAALWTSALGPPTIWLNEFFNRSVDRIYFFHAPVPGNLPEVGVGIDPASGELRDALGGTVHADFVLVDTQTDLVGEEVAADPGRGMRLLSVTGPVTVAEQVSGVFADRWTGASAQYARFGCDGGELEVALSSDPTLHTSPQTVVAFAGEIELAQATLDPVQASTTLVVPLLETDGACVVQFSISPTAVPAEVIGTPDTRALGVRFDGLRYRP